MNALFCTCMTLALAANADPLFISHRGESADALKTRWRPLSFRGSVEVPAVELDVHLTADDKLVVIHDKDTERTCGVKRVVKESQYAELAELDAGSWKGPQFADQRLVLLDDVLAKLPAGKRCVIEVKVGPESVPALVRAVRQSRLPASQLAVISFNAGTIAEVRRQLPELETQWLASFKTNEETGVVSPSVTEIIATAQGAAAHGVGLSYKGPIDAAFVQQVHDAGLKCYVWTVDDAAEARRLRAAGVDGITSNKARWLMDQLAE
ncbi:MAG: glycerophosphodiester phosphodiesterase family protein [Planctomycetaceae bacterium]